MRIEVGFAERTVSFDMGYDPQSVADVTTKYLFEKKGACEPEVMHVMNKVLQEGDLAIDVGANIGVFTLLMAKLVGPEGKVLAFEPGPNNLPKLETNCKMNRLTNVTIIPKPLWSEVTTVTLYLSHDSGLNSLTASVDHISKIDLQAETLDSVATATPRLIKLDAEGAEPFILQGGEKLLARGVPFIISEMNFLALARAGTSSREFRDWMSARGYDTFLLNAMGSLPLYVPPSVRIECEEPNLNVLFSTLANVANVWTEVKLE
jgi:FkbM family methyltransferase